MAELIAALDEGRCGLFLAQQLYHEAGVRWFKVGPQTMLDPDWIEFLVPRNIAPTMDPLIFLDLKLADTHDTVSRAVEGFARRGIAAVSTFTGAATQAALDAARGSDLKVWRALRLTDGSCLYERDGEEPVDLPDGFICPLSDAAVWKRDAIDVSAKFICPGIRLDQTDDYGNHVETATAAEAGKVGIDFAVVGRPIWQSSTPVSTARAYVNALANQMP